ncbi:MAG: PD-(D/E)XK nuclease family protein [Spirochaetaceae bacterium]|nr:PD-(D/E)XK nuclease family protein [Spirochaetaceae bacterium]
MLRRAAERYRLNPFAATLVVVPTVRHGDQFRRRLLALCGVALDLQVETPRGVARRLHTGTATASIGAARELLGSVAYRQIASGAAAHFAPLGAAAALPLLWAAVDQLLAEDVSADRFTAAAAATGDPQLAAVAAIYGAWRRELEEHGWLAPAALPAAAAAAGDAAGLPFLVIVDGFRFFHGGELRLLAALARNRDLLLAFDPDAGERARHSYERLGGLLPDAVIERSGGRAPAPRMQGCVAADREAGLRAMARAIKRRLTDDRSLRPSDCGVTFRRLGPVLGLARQVFAEYDLPLDPVAGEPLANRPLGVWMRRLLRLPAEGWRLRDLITVLGSGFIDCRRFGLDPWQITRIARCGRQHHLWAGRDALDRLALLAPKREQESRDRTGSEREQGPTLPGMEARGLISVLSYLYAFLEPPPAPAGAHARQVKAALFGQPPLIRAGVRTEPGLIAEIDALRAHLDDIAAADDATQEGPVPFAAFVDRLLARMEAPAAILREAGGVLLAPMIALSGLRLAHLEAGGLVEGEFPASRSAPLLLSRDARQALGAAGLELPPPPEPTEDELWLSVRSRADTALTAWRTRLDERGRQVAASLYFDDAAGEQADETGAPEPAEAASRRELAIACTSAWSRGSAARPDAGPAWEVVRVAANVEQRRRSFVHAGEFEGAVGAGLRPELTDARAVWSATRLESYRTCAFQFFGHYALRLHELDEEQDSADAATRGTVMHAMLQDALADLNATDTPLTPDTVDSAVARLHASGKGIWERAPDEHGFGRVGLWRIEREPALERLEDLLRAEAERCAGDGVTALLGTETRVESALPLEPPLAVGARIDRLDTAAGLAVVVDYKTGSSISRRELDGDIRVQLPLYAYLAREREQAGRVIARYAWLRARHAPWQLDSDDPADRELIDSVVARAGEVRAAVEAGDFRVSPNVQPCPWYCAFQHACRVNQFSRWKS